MHETVAVMTTEAAESRNTRKALRRDLRPTCILSKERRNYLTTNKRRYLPGRELQSYQDNARLILRTQWHNGTIAV
jgi:hypothetical protein